MEKTTTERDNLRYTKIPFKNGSGAMPALGFGTLIPDLTDTKNATRLALEAGFRQLDSASTPRLPFNPETSKTQGTRTAK